MEKYLNSAKELPDFSEKSHIVVLRVAIEKKVVAENRYNPVLLLAGGKPNPDYRQKPRRHLEMPTK
jgi:hypothetical protein|tara:strand:- start:2721 stop:2918 length:198 start_codon:yes stop_codon:yes gene_type:complete